MSGKHRKNLPAIRAHSTGQPAPGSSNSSSATGAALQLPDPVNVSVQPPAAPIPVALQFPAQPIQLATQPPADPERPPRLFWVNVILFIVFGTLVSWWLYYYTDWLEAFTGLLSLTGIFAWLALATKVVPEDRLKYFQSKIWSKVVEHYAFGLVFGSLLGICLVTASYLGTIEITGTQAGSNQAFWIYGPGDKPDLNAPESLPATGHYRAVKFSGQDFIVRVPGYPEKRVTVRAWRRTEQHVPFSFVRPVVLIWPEKSVVLQVKPGGARLVVEVENNKQAPISFDGKPVWIGCEDLIVPRHVFEGRLKELNNEKPATFDKVVAAWSQTQALTSNPSELREGMKIKASLFRNTDNPDHAYARTTEYTVRPVQPAAAVEQQDMVQLLALRVVTQ